MKYWIFIANDNKWDWTTNQKVGEVEIWSAYGEKIRKKYFSEVQKGDKVIGYSSGKSKSFVSTGVIEKSLSQDPNKREIEIRKISDLQSPVSIDRVRQIKPFDNKLTDIKLNTTVIPLTADEYNLLMSIFHDAFLDLHDDVDIDLSSADISIDEALKFRPTPAKQADNSTTWTRDSRIAKAALNRVDYICELATESDSHESFIAHCTKKNYVEAHHLIPMKEQENFNYSLDNARNIVALCPNCHRMIHYSEQSIRKEKITEIFGKREKDLDAYKITLSDLYRMYGI